MADQSRLRTIVDRICELLLTIDGDETIWRTHLRSARIFRGAADLDLARPVAVVQPSIEPGELVAFSGGYYEAVQLDIVGLVRHSTGPWQAADDLGIDIKKLIRANPTIQALDGERLATDWRETTTAEIVVDPDESGAGGAQVRVSTRLLHVTTDSVL